MYQEFLEWAEKMNWNIMLTAEEAAIPETIKKRYKVPEEWLTFIGHFSVCSNAADTRWFLTSEDYSNSGAFKWNEFELLTLKAAGLDLSWKKRIKAVWDKHLPIVMGVGGEYEYYAIDTDSQKVVYGYEPEFEETEVVAESFEVFIKKIISGEIVL